MIDHVQPLQAEWISVWIYKGASCTANTGRIDFCLDLLRIGGYVSMVLAPFTHYNIWGLIPVITYTHYGTQDNIISMICM